MTALLIFDFDVAHEIAEWFSINDAVMGGVSLGEFVQREPGIARFCGQVSFENNGGFSSVRSRLIRTSLAGYEGIEMRVRGDGGKNTNFAFKPMSAPGPFLTRFR